MIDPIQLDEILEVLREHGVSQFSCPEFSVNLLPSAPAHDEDIGTAIEEGNDQAKAPLARGIFAHPSLWAGGKPPSFPKAGE